MSHRFRWIHRFAIRWTSVLVAVLWTASAAFAQPAAPPLIGTAFITTTDFMSGSYSVIDLETLTVFPNIPPNGINSDTLVRYDSSTNLLYLVNRFGADSIQIIDPRLGYTTPPGAELSVENQSNPHDIALINSVKAYVSRAGRAELLIINPSSLTITGGIDLSNLIKPNDVDGSPEPYRMLVQGDTVFLMLQHLDRTQTLQPRLAPGEVVVIDSTMDMVTTVIPLATPNPFSDFQYTAALPRGPRLLVSSVNEFNMLDGGIEAIDLTTSTVDMGFVLSEMTANGNITFFEVVSATQAYAIVSAVDQPGNSLIQFNPTTGQEVSPLATGLPFTLNFAVNNAGELYIAPVDTDAMPPDPGLRIFDTATAMETTAAPIPLGSLPGGWVVMVEEHHVGLTVHKTGTGSGTVSSFPEGLVCGETCTSNFLVGSAVVLTAVPDAGSTFVGWQEPTCPGTDDCAVSLDKDRAVTAVFDAAQ